MKRSGHIVTADDLHKTVILTDLYDRAMTNQKIPVSFVNLCQV